MTRVSAGRRADAELRDLRDMRGASTLELDGPRARKAPSVALGLERQPLRNERPRLSSRMSALDAAKERLGLRSAQPQVMPRGTAGACSGAGAGAGAGAASKHTVESIIAICYDEARDRLLYGLRYAAPWNSSAYDVWSPASDFGLTDAVMQNEAKRQKQLPIIFTTPWTGGAGSHDPNKPIPLQVILDEIEDDRVNDGQDPRGAPIDDPGEGQEEVEEATQLRRRPPRGQGGGPVDYATVVAEAVKAAMLAVDQRRGASALDDLRAFGEEEEEERRGGGGQRGRPLQRREGGHR